MPSNRPFFTSIVLPFALIGLLLAVCIPFSSAVAQDGAKEAGKATRKDFASDASFIVGTFQPKTVVHGPEAMAQAANAFLDKLSDELRGKCSSELTTPVRREWTNLPARPNADGVRMGDLNKEQVEHACQLMAALFSKQGYQKMCDIMLADDQLLRGGQPRRGFGTEDFSIVIFGSPSPEKPWGFQIDGHHVGVNLSIEGESVSMSPSFIGTQPHKFSIAGREYKPFANETDLAHELAMSLNDEQTKEAVLNNRRAKILAGPGRDGQVPAAKGLSCSKLDDEQKKLLVSLIHQWVGDLPESSAKARKAEIEAEMDQMTFSWNGNRKSESDVSYTIQSPSLIIEYACQDLGGNPLDHLHSVYRNPKNEYGGQLDD